MSLFSTERHPGGSAVTDVKRDHRILVVRSFDRAWDEVERLLRAVPGARIVAQTTDAYSVPHLAFSSAPTAIITSAYIDGDSALPLIVELRRLVPGSKLILLGGDFDPRELLIYLTIGVNGILLWQDVFSGASRNLLLALLDGDVLAVSRRAAVATRLEDRLGWGLPQVDLSERERIVMRRLAEGLPEKEIAQVEGFSHRTVERVVAKLEAKLEAPTLFTLALRAVRLGVLR
jgi:DNA-binding NarL/FixJ family response regulator